MRRREFLGVLGGATALSFAAQAQQSSKIPLVGMLWHGSKEKELANPWHQNVHDDFASFGYIADKTIRYEERFPDERQNLYDQFASELVAAGADILVCFDLPAALALKKATSRIPIVFLGLNDSLALSSGLVQSLARPGGNATGLVGPARDMYFKAVEIFKQLIPGVSRLALLVNPDIPVQVAFQADFYATAARANGIQLEVFEARDKRTIDETFPKIVQAKCDGVVIANQGAFYLLRDEISEAALFNRLPTLGPSDVFVPSGILVSYSPVLRQRFVDLVTYAVRILRGEKPSDLPVEFPTKFELVLNLKTAAALNLTVPPLVLTAADRVIE
jgi:putative ABC transport system substrate-binding protein